MSLYFIFNYLQSSSVVYLWRFIKIEMEETRQREQNIIVTEEDIRMHDKQIVQCSTSIFNEWKPVLIINLVGKSILMYPRTRVLF